MLVPLRNDAGYLFLLLNKNNIFLFLLFHFIFFNLINIPKFLIFFSFVFQPQEKKLSEIFSCKPNEVLQGKILREIDDDFLNNQTNSFQRVFHERKPGYVNLNINGWFTKTQIINNYEMLLQELDEWKTSENGIRWKHKSD